MKSLMILRTKKNSDKHWPHKILVKTIGEMSVHILGG